MNENKKNFLIANLGIKSLIAYTAIYIIFIIKFYILKLRGRNPRYFFLTHPVLASQIVYDTLQKKYIQFRIRDEIDYATSQQIYSSDDYGTSKLKRHSDIQLLYKQIVESKLQPLIIDCGGNIGLASKYFSSNYDLAKIICVEPDFKNIKQAKANNISTNIDFLEAAIGPENGSGTIVDPGLGNNAYRISSASNGEINIFSINHLLEKYSKNKYTPFIIKIDIEGFEEDLFSKNLEWVDLFPLLIIELHDWMLPKSSNSKNFLQAISKLNRDFVYIGENIFSISNTLL